MRCAARAPDDGRRRLGPPCGMHLTGWKGLRAARWLWRWRPGPKEPRLESGDSSAADDHEATAEGLAGEPDSGPPIADVPQPEGITAHTRPEPAGGGRRQHPFDWIQVASDAVTALAAVASLLLSYTALQLAGENERRLDRQDRLQAQQYAVNVYIGAAPPAVYEDDPEECATRAVDEPSCHGRPPAPGHLWWVIINAGGLPVEDAWVRDASGEFTVVIASLERCTMYALPVEVMDELDRRREFRPAELFFTDSTGSWRRVFGEAGVEPRQHVPRPQQDDGVVLWSEPVPNCAG